jgi:hypothetical protein
MDTVTLVDAQIDDGQRLLDRLTEEGIVVRAACWVNPVEEDRWSLYIATPAVDEKGATEAYRQVYRVLRSLGDTWITSSDVKLVGEKHPVAHEALDLQQRSSGRMLTRPRHPLLGSMPVEEMYVYPPGKVEVWVYGMVFDGAPTRALHLALEPHNPNSSLIIGSGPQQTVYHAKTGTDWLVAAPMGATLEQDEIGRLVLAWDLHGHRLKSTANEVWSFAKLGMHGFRFLQQPA